MTALADPPRAAASEVTLTERQAEAWAWLHTPGVVDLLYGGAKGGGKTKLMVTWAYAMCLRAIDRYQLTGEPLYHVGWMGRKQAIDFTGTTLQTWMREVPATEYVIREATAKHPRHILVRDAVALDIGGLDAREDISKFNSAEYWFVAVDQAEETTRDDVAVLRASRRLRINGERPEGGYKGLWTANPRQCWLRDEFILAPTTERRYVPALPSDNPYLPEDYTQTLTEAFRHRPEMLAAYLHGDWDAISDACQVILEQHVRAAADLRFHNVQPVTTIVCDPSRFGDDETPIYVLRDTDIISEDIRGKQDLMATANRLFVLWREHGGIVVVDVIGLGAGIVDRLREMGVPVMAVNGSEKAADAEKYYNLRAELWFLAGRMFADSEIALSHQDPVLVGQLCTPNYSFRNGRILVEDKDKIKARLGRSPDRGDCYVMGLAGYRYQRAKTALGPGMTVYRVTPEHSAPDPRSYEGRRAAERRRQDERRQHSWRP